MNDTFFNENLTFRTYIHTHDYHTDCHDGAPIHYFAYIEQGNCRIVSGQNTIEATAGDIFYIPKDLPYHSYWHCADKIQFKSFGFRYFPESSIRQYTLQKIECSRDVKTRIQNLPTDQIVDSMLLGDFYSVVASVLPLMRYIEQTSGVSIIEKARQYISRSKNCSIPDIARHCMISEAALYDIFRKEAGCTPNELRQQILCQKAALLLSTTDLPVQEISDSLYFSSTSYFRKALRKCTGKTPREIRQSARKI